MMRSMKEILFICTGNFYRSRFAEAWINFEARRRSIPWRAFSRGLGLKDQGDLSPYTREAMERRAIPMDHTAPRPVGLTADCLARAHRAIALKRAEHQPAMYSRFPDWARDVEYWDIHDIDVWSPDQGIAELELRLLRLLPELKENP